MSLQAGLGGDIINFVICVIVFFAIGYFVAYFMIGKSNWQLRVVWATIPMTMPMRIPQRIQVLLPETETVRQSVSLLCWAAAKTLYW